MGFIDRVKAAFGGIQVQGEQTIYRGASPISYATSSVNSVVLEKIYHECSTVSSCIDLIASETAKLDISGGCASIIEQNLNGFGSFGFIEALVTDMMIYGYAVVKVTTYGARQDIELVRHGTVQIEVLTDGRVAVKDNGSSYIIVQDGHWLTDPLSGRTERIALLAQLLVAIDLKSYSENTKGPGNIAVLRYPKPVSPVLRKAQTKALQQAINTTGKRGVLALDNSAELIFVDTTKLTTADTQNLIGILQLKVAAAFKVPPFLAGGSGDVKYNNTTAGVTRFHRENIAPLTENIASTLSIGLGMTCAFNLNGLLRGDSTAQITLATGAVSGGVMTVNEARERFMDLPKIEGGDTLGGNGGGAGQYNVEDRRGEMPSDDGSPGTEKPPEDEG